MSKPGVRAFDVDSSLTGLATRMTAQKGETVIRVALSDIDPDPDQPRTGVSEEPLSELADSIKSVGIIQPLVLRVHPTGARKYMLVAGERRWRAGQLAGVTDAPAIVRHYESTKLRYVQAIENLQREDLSPPDAVRAIVALIAVDGVDATAKNLGKNRSWISKLVTISEAQGATKQVLEQQLASDIETIYSVALLEQSDPAAAQQLVERWKDPSARAGQRTQIRAALEPTRSKKPGRKARSRKAPVYTVSSVAREDGEYIVRTQLGVLRFDASLIAALKDL